MNLETGGDGLDLSAVRPGVGNAEFIGLRALAVGGSDETVFIDGGEIEMDFRSVNDPWLTLTADENCEAQEVEKGKSAHEGMMA